MLLDHNCDIGEKDQLGQTAVGQAILCNDIENFKKLIEKVDDLN